MLYKKGAHIQQHIPIPFTEIDRVIPILNKISLFGGLQEQHLHTVYRSLQLVKYTDSELIFEEGDSPSNIYIILTGTVKMVLNYGEEPLELIEFSVGNCIGETSVIGIQPHSATAVAQGEVELLVLSRSALMSFFHEDTELFSYVILNIAREACRRLGRADNTILHYFSDHSGSH